MLEEISPFLANIWAINNFIISCHWKEGRVPTYWIDFFQKFSQFLDFYTDFGNLQEYHLDVLFFFLPKQNSFQDSFDTWRNTSSSRFLKLNGFTINFLAKEAALVTFSCLELNFSRNSTQKILVFYSLWKNFYQTLRSDTTIILVT